MDANVDIKLIAVAKEEKQLHKKIPILTNINFEVYKGDICVIVGPSGSGKTTLLNIISGIDKATKGQVFIKQTDICQIKDKQLVALRKQHIAYIYQKYGLIPILTAYDNISLAQYLVPKHKRLFQIETIAQVMQIQSILNKFPHELSGGQKQRVAIARSIIKQPSLLLCDEPTGALDTISGKKIIDLLLQINYLFKTTIVIVTHDLVFLKFASRIIHINDGMIAKIQTQDNKSYISKFANQNLEILTNKPQQVSINFWTK